MVNWEESGKTEKTWLKGPPTARDEWFFIPIKLLKGSSGVFVRIPKLQGFWKMGVLIASGCIESFPCRISGHHERVQSGNLIQVLYLFQTKGQPMDMWQISLVTTIRAMERFSTLSIFFEAVFGDLILDQLQLVDFRLMTLKSTPFTDPKHFADRNVGLGCWFRTIVCPLKKSA